MVGNLDHVFDGTTHTGVDFERGQRCSARWFGYCMGSEATGAELDSETHFSFAGELDKIWDITGVAVFGHNITGVQLEFFDMDQVSISRTDQVWHNAASFVINVTDSANSWYSDSDGDFRLKEIELHGTHSLLQRDSKPVDVNAPATLGLLSLAGLLLLRRRVWHHSTLQKRLPLCNLFLWERDLELGLISNLLPQYSCALGSRRVGILHTRLVSVTFYLILQV